jgi:hypothetical protein
MHLYDPTDPNGLTQWVLDGRPVLVQGEFANEWAEDQFHNHPDVAILPNPQFEAQDNLQKHVGSPAKKLKQKHLDRLATIGVRGTHTVHEVAAQAAKTNPQMRLRGYI